MIESSRIFLSVFAGFLYCVVWNGQGHAQNNAATRLAPKGELRAGLIASNPVSLRSEPTASLARVGRTCARSRREARRTGSLDTVRKSGSLQ